MMHSKKVILFFAITLLALLQQGRTSFATCDGSPGEQPGMVFSNTGDQSSPDTKIRCLFAEDEEGDVLSAESQEGEPLMVLKPRKKRSSKECRGSTTNDTTSQTRRRGVSEPCLLDRTTQQKSSSERVVKKQDLESLKSRALQFQSIAMHSIEVARVAGKQATKTPVAEVVSLWDEAVARSREAVIPLDEVLQFYIQGLSALPDNHDDLTGWRNEIENIGNAKKTISALIIWCTANKADIVTEEASSKARTAFAAEAGPLWDEAVAKNREAAAAWDEVLWVYTQGLAALPDNRNDLKTEWRNAIENAQKAKNITSVLTICYGAHKANSVAIVAAQKARTAFAGEDGPLWDEAVARSEEAVAVWDELLRLYDQELAVLPDDGDDLKTAWRSAIENAENTSNKHSALIICYTANKINSVANVAQEKAQRVLASESVPLWDEALVKRGETVAAFDEVLNALNRGLRAIPVHRDDLRIWWRYWIENVEYLKSINSTLVIRCMAIKADRVAMLAEEKISKAGDAKADSLWDEAMVKRAEAITIWYQVLEALNEGLDAIPEHRDELKSWWRRAIQRADSKVNDILGW